MDPSHTRGHTDVSDLWELSAGYMFSQCIYEHTPMPPFCYRTMYILVYLSRLAKPAPFSRTAEHFSTSYLRSIS